MHSSHEGSIVELENSHQATNKTRSGSCQLEKADKGGSAERKRSQVGHSVLAGDGLRRFEAGGDVVTENHGCIPMVMKDLKAHSINKW